MAKNVTLTQLRKLAKKVIADLHLSPADEVMQDLETKTDLFDPEMHRMYPIADKATAIEVIKESIDCITD